MEAPLKGLRNVEWDLHTYIFLEVFAWEPSYLPAR